MLERLKMKKVLFYVGFWIIAIATILLVEHFFQMSVAVAVFAIIFFFAILIIKDTQKIPMRKQRKGYNCDKMMEEYDHFTDPTWSFLSCNIFHKAR